jgi:hypothetical protein
MPEDPQLAIDEESLEGTRCADCSLDDGMKAWQFDV